VREESPAVAALLTAADDGKHPLAPGVAVLAERTAHMRPLANELAALSQAGRLNVPLPNLAESYVHMWLNRLCRSENRVQEYVTYALLARVLTARNASS